jgi:hypothetical protein
MKSKKIISIFLAVAILALPHIFIKPGSGTPRPKMFNPPEIEVVQLDFLV